MIMNVIADKYVLVGVETYHLAEGSEGFSGTLFRSMYDSISA